MSVRTNDWMRQAERDLEVASGHVRDANGHAQGAPFENYGPRQSGRALVDAGEVLGFARARLAERERGGG